MSAIIRQASAGMKCNKRRYIFSVISEESINPSVSANKIGKKEHVISTPALSQLSIGSIASGLVIVVSWERYGRAITKRKIKASIFNAKNMMEKIFFSFIMTSLSNKT